MMLLCGAGCHAKSCLTEDHAIPTSLPHHLAAGGLFFVLAFFAFTSLSAVDLFMNERRLVFREIRGVRGDQVPGRGDRDACVWSRRPMSKRRTGADV